MMYLNKKITIKTLRLLTAIMMAVGLVGITYTSYAVDVIKNAAGIIKSVDDIECQKGLVDCLYKNNEDIVIGGIINWNKNKNLILHTKGNIIFEKGGKIISSKNGSVIIKSGMMPGEKEKYEKTVIFKDKLPQVEVLGSGKIKIYYNPVKGGEEHKYHNPDHYFYSKHVRTGEEENSNNLNTYMLVNNVYELQDITLLLSGSYALSQDINAAETRNWNNGSGFEPLKDKSKNMPFSGNFDGNGYSIKKLFIDRKKDKEDDVGLFGMCAGWDISHNVIENLVLEDFNITGDHYVGSLAGFAANSDLLNIKVINPIINGRDIVGGLVGTTDRIRAESIEFVGDVKITTDIEKSEDENKGFVVGGVGKSDIALFFNTEHERDKLLETCNPFGNHDKRTRVCISGIFDTSKICLNLKDGNSFMIKDDKSINVTISEDNLNSSAIKRFLEHGNLIPDLISEGKN